MANIAGGDAGRTGPYWRRQMGTTLPGERTAPELQLINRLRQKQGLPPIGGPVGDDTRFAQPGRPIHRPQAPLRQASPSGDDPRNDFFREVEHDGGGYMGIPEHQPFDEFPGQAGIQPMPNPQDVGGIRERLLRQFTGNAPMQHSREALQHFLQQQQQKKAMPGRARPILPTRPPLRGAQQARPY